MKTEATVLDPGLEIKIWLLRQGLKESDLAREIGVRISAVSHFLSGRMSSEKIRANLIARGCPQELLDRAWIGAGKRRGAPRGAKRHPDRRSK